MQDLIKALETIKKECLTHENCSECPLRSPVDGCHLRFRSPDNWDIKDKMELPRVFR